MIYRATIKDAFYFRRMHTTHRGLNIILYYIIRTIITNGCWSLIITSSSRGKYLLTNFSETRFLLITFVATISILLFMISPTRDIYTFENDPMPISRIKWMFFSTKNEESDNSKSGFIFRVKIFKI